MWRSWIEAGVGVVVGWGREGKEGDPAQHGDDAGCFPDVRGDVVGGEGGEG